MIRGGRAAGARAPVRVCIDADAGWRLLGGRIAVGAKRSPLHTPAQAAALAAEILDREDLRLVGIMAYEAQIAGLRDRPPGPALRAGALPAMQARSPPEVAGRGAPVVG